MKDYRYYLFDLDGTLLDTKEIIYMSYEYLLGKHLNISVNRGEVFSSIGLPIRRIFERYFGPLDDKKFQELALEYRTYQHEHLADTVCLFDGVGEMLQMLAAKGKTCALVTSRGQISCEDYLKRLGLEGFFSVRIMMESTENHKPHPEPVLHAMSLLGAKDPSEVVFIGDSEYDIECGKRAGVDTGLALWGLLEPYESSIEPTYYLHKPSEVDEQRGDW